MAAAKRRAATPAKKGSTKAATEDSTELLGPDGDPVAQEAATGDAPSDSDPASETGRVDRDDRAEKPSSGRPRGYPLPVWPD